MLACKMVTNGKYKNIGCQHAYTSGKSSVEPIWWNIQYWSTIFTFFSVSFASVRFTTCLPWRGALGFLCETQGRLPNFCLGARGQESASPWLMAFRVLWLYFLNLVYDWGFSAAILVALTSHFGLRWPRPNQSRCAFFSSLCCLCLFFCGGLFASLSFLWWQATSASLQFWGTVRVSGTLPRPASLLLSFHVFHDVC